MAHNRSTPGLQGPLARVLAAEPVLQRARLATSAGITLGLQRHNPPQMAEEHHQVAALLLAHVVDAIGTDLGGSGIGWVEGGKAGEGDRLLDCAGAIH